MPHGAIEGKSSALDCSVFECVCVGGGGGGGVCRVTAGTVCVYVCGGGGTAGAVCVGGGGLQSDCTYSVCVGGGGVTAG